MPTYNDHFTFDVKDIELIEEALRAEMSNALDTGTNEDTGSAPQYATTPRERKIGALLGKIHNQKIFYSVVATTDVPLG